MEFLQNEAQDVIKDVSNVVSYIGVSKTLKKANSVFINVETRDRQQLCVEMSVQGFRVCFRIPVGITLRLKGVGELPNLR